ncbi:hypothetical protein OQA88_2717 [Cercophora sp. LCS_1]
MEGSSHSQGQSPPISIRPRITKRAPTVPTIPATSPPHPRPGNLDIPSPISPSRSPTEGSPQRGSRHPSPTRASSASPDGHSPRSSIHLENDGITIFTAIDRGFTAAERIHNTDHMQEGPVTDFDGVSTIQGLSLGKLLWRSCYQGPKQGAKSWLPLDKLFGLVNHENVRQQLSIALSGRQPAPSNQDLDRYTEEVCSHLEYIDPATRKTLRTSRRCIFATLALANQIHAAPAFADADVWDKDLPLERHDDYLVSRADHSKKMTIPQGWDYLAIDSFCLYQHYTLAPFFDLGSKNEVPFFELSADNPLPWVENRYGERRRFGHHGTVWRIQVHEAHHNFPTDDGENPYFAVKELTSNDCEGIDFKKEVTAWARSVGVAGHQHIIRLLATWHRNESWYLLFGWADGNLSDYWMANPKGSRGVEPERHQKLAQWVAEQCRGVANGLAKIHRASSHDNEHSLVNYGIHGDIKPENILRFEDKLVEFGRLVICDFGFTRFYSRRSRSAADLQGHSPTYRAPEHDTRDPTDRQRHISRAYDIWGLGCVYLEFLTWYLLGCEAVKETFTGMRTTEDRGELIPSDKFFVCVTVDGTSSFGVIVKPCVGRVSSRAGDFVKL